MSSCLAPPAVTLCPSSPVTLLLLFTLRFRSLVSPLRCLLFIFALLTRSSSCSSLICNSLASSFCLATFFSAVWARVLAARVQARAGRARAEPASTRYTTHRRGAGRAASARVASLRVLDAASSLIVQTRRQTILRGTWVNCSEIGCYFVLCMYLIILPHCA